MSALSRLSFNEQTTTGGVLMVDLKEIAFNVFDPTMQAGIMASGISLDLSSTRTTNLLLIQILRDAIREVPDGAP
jgi:hypothetical protein